MRKFQPVFISFIALFFVHHTFGDHATHHDPDLWKDINGRSSSPHIYEGFDNFYSNAGDEVPWPMIVKPYWTFPEETIGQSMIEKGFTERRISDHSVGLWKEIDSLEVPRILKVRIVEKPEGRPVGKMFEVTQVNLETQKPMSLGYGNLEDWTKSADILKSYNGRQLVYQKALDEAGYYVVCHSKGDESSQFLRLAEVQTSEGVLLGVSIVKDGIQYQSNHLFRRIDESCYETDEMIMKDMCRNNLLQ